MLASVESCRVGEKEGERIREREIVWIIVGMRVEEREVTQFTFQVLGMEY